jgi:hypothetical protein
MMIRPGALNMKTVSTSAILFVAALLWASSAHAYNFNVKIQNRGSTPVKVESVYWNVPGVIKSNQCKTVLASSTNIRPKGAANIICGTPTHNNRNAPNAKRWKRRMTVRVTCLSPLPELEEGEYHTLHIPGKKKYFSRTHALSNKDTYVINLDKNLCAKSKKKAKSRKGKRTKRKNRKKKKSRK